jgi:hypothetical protein
MPRGGARKNAGRKRGGHNSRTRELARKAESLGISPLAVLLQLASDPDQPVHVRLSAAPAAAPYCHPKFSALPATLSPPFGCDGKLIEGSSEPIPPAVTQINILPVESGFHLDQDGNLVRAAQPGPDLKIVSNIPAPELVDDSNDDSDR